MTVFKIHHKLALERCRMYVAQLHAVNYFDTENIEASAGDLEVVVSLLKGLSRDLDLLEKMAGTSDT